MRKSRQLRRHLILRSLIRIVESVATILTLGFYDPEWSGRLADRYMIRACRRRGQVELDHWKRAERRVLAELTIKA